MVDTAVIKIRAGNGGDGRVSLRHMKYVEKGGPDGGDGGNGGSVYLVADNNMATLMDFKSKAVYEGDDGEGGGGSNMTGKSGMDLYIKVPVGTLVYELPANFDLEKGKYDKEGGVLVADFTKRGQTVLIGQGGVGGKGNYGFRSSTNQTPMQYTRGSAGEQKILRLEMKLIADIGLVGAPNAGKSTLLNHLTNANAKIGNYPFTTLEPNLGVCTFIDGRTVVLADIPGLIEGASSGKGLGDDFLRHIERTKLLVVMIDPYVESADFVGAALSSYKMLLAELSQFNRDLTKKEMIVVINKLDITEVKEDFENIKKAFSGLGVDVVGISAFTGEGLDNLKLVMMKKLDGAEKDDSLNVADVAKPVKMYNISNLPNKRVVFGNVSEGELRL